MRFFPLLALIAVLRADRTINLRQQAGGDLDKARATAQNSGGKTGQVTHNAAAQRNNTIIAFNLLAKQPFAQFSQLIEIFTGLSGRYKIAVMRNRRAIQAQLAAPVNGFQPNWNPR